MPRIRSGAAIHRPETTHITLPPIPEVAWQQPQETHVLNSYQNLTNETHTNTHMPELKQKSDVVSQRNLTPSIRIQYGTTPRKPN